MDGWADITDSTLLIITEKKQKTEEQRKMKKVNGIKLSSVEKQTKSGD